jgi:hypothetical protein
VFNLQCRRKDVKLDVYEFSEVAPDQLLTRWRFSCRLDVLPWKPLLAAAGVRKAVPV